MINGDFEIIYDTLIKVESAWKNKRHANLFLDVLFDERIFTNATSLTCCTEYGGIQIDVKLKYDHNIYERGQFSLTEAIPFHMVVTSVDNPRINELIEAGYKFYQSGGLYPASFENPKPEVTWVSYTTRFKSVNDIFFMNCR